MAAEGYYADQGQQRGPVTITVSSNGNSDMDLFVFSDKVKLDKFKAMPNIDLAPALALSLAHDNGMSKDCFVEFTAPATQDYWVMLINRKSKDQPERNGK